MRKRRCTDLRSVCSEQRPRAGRLQPAARPRENDNDSDEEDDCLRSYEPIDLLQDAGIKATDITKLKNDGFATIGQLFQVSQRKLLGVKGISEDKMDKVLDYMYSISF
jgi:DNA-directed RNA polymerase alpha subunit